MLLMLPPLMLPPLGKHEAPACGPWGDDAADAAAAPSGAVAPRPASAARARAVTAAPSRPSASAPSPARRPGRRRDPPSPLLQPLSESPSHSKGEPRTASLALTRNRHAEDRDRPRRQPLRRVARDAHQRARRQRDALAAQLREQRVPRRARPVRRAHVRGRARRLEQS